MAVVTLENVDSRDLTDGLSATLTFTIKGTAEADVALSALKLAVPTGFEGLSTTKFNVTPVYVDTANEEISFWRGTATYGTVLNPIRPVVGDSFFNFNTGGGLEHITQGLTGPTGFVPPGKALPDSKGAIGITDQGVEGVDITVPVYTFSQTDYKSNSDVTSAYKVLLSTLTGTVNNATFKDFAPETVLFEGAEGSQRGVDDWEITYRFAAIPNRDDLKVGDISGIVKKGHQYLWVRYEKDVSEDSIVQVPRAAYVETVYRRADFSLLDIGT